MQPKISMSLMYLDPYSPPVSANETDVNPEPPKSPTNDEEGNPVLITQTDIILIQ